METSGKLYPAPDSHCGERSDRRRFSLKTVLISFYRPRRRYLRRQSDQAHQEWLDTLPVGSFFLGLAIFILSMLDGLLTLKLLTLGAEEANPFMRLLLAQSPVLFLIVKAVMAATCVLLLLRLRSLRLRQRYPVAWILYGWLVISVALIHYELQLLALLS